MTPGDRAIFNQGGDLNKLGRGILGYATKPNIKALGLKEARSVTMNIFSKKKYFLFKSFVKIELSYSFTINMVSTAENCKER